MDRLFAPLLARMLQRNLAGDLERLADLLAERAEEAGRSGSATRMAG